MQKDNLDRNVKVDQIISKLRSEKILDVSTYIRIDRLGTANNQLYILNNIEHKYILKIYHKDERMRLEREYYGYDFFNRLGTDFVPKNVYKNELDYYAIYTFIDGNHVVPEKVNNSQMRLIADFLIFTYNNSLKAQELKMEFMPLIGPAFSLQETIDKIYMKLGKFQNDESIKSFELVKNFTKKYNLEKLFKELLNYSSSGIDRKFIEKKVPRKKQSLGMGDLQLGNVIFNGAKAYFIDFEDFGWDDPVNIIAWFLHHDKSIGLTYEVKKDFIEYYLTNANFADNEFRLRLKEILNLGAILWLSTYLLAMTKQRVEVAKFSDPKLDVNSYLKERINRFEKKLIEIQSEQNLSNLVIV